MTNIIQTHNDIFHADEVFATALLLNFYFDNRNIMAVSSIENIPYNDNIIVLRSRDMVDNNDIIKVDVGGDYNPDKLIFDHHHDKNIEASNLLILDWLYAKDHISDDVYKSLLPLMLAVSMVDTNKDNILFSISDFAKQYEGVSIQMISQVISNFNRNPRDNDNQFELAVAFALSIIDNEVYHGLERIKAEATYNKGKELTKDVICFDEFCPIWKSKNEYKFAVMPNPQGWSITSINSNDYPLPNPKNTDNLIFIHKANFIAVFKTKEDIKQYITEW